MKVEIVKIMTIEDLKKIYQEFLEFHKKEFLKNIYNRVGVNRIKNFSEELAERVFENYEKVSFIKFCILLRDLWFYKDPFLILKKFNDDSEFLSVFLKFLIDKKLVSLKSEKVKFKVNFGTVFSKPLSERKIYGVLREKIRNINMRKSVLENLGYSFSWREKYDQIPISLESAVFNAIKISEYYPFREKFIFIGADDFVYLVLSLVDTSLKFKVIDIDGDLLFLVDNLSRKFNLEINTEKIDIRRKSVREKFYGTYLNPPYNFFGSLSFIRFSSQLIENEGGLSFLILGDESIGSRMIFLQEEISRMNFIIREISKNKIFYHFQKIYKESYALEREFKKMGIRIKDKEYLTASLFVLEKIPFRPKRIKIKGEIYSYL